MFDEAGAAAALYAIIRDADDWGAAEKRRLGSYGYKEPGGVSS
jgi:hypothetical protein